MLKVISTHIFVNHRLHAGFLDALARSGAEGIEIYAMRPHFDYTSRSEVREIADWFKSNSIRPWALHCPLRAPVESSRSGEQAVNVVHSEKSRRIDAMDEVKRALESAEQIPFANLILHLGEREDAWTPHTLEHAITAVEHLHAFARPLGVQLLLENLDNPVAQPENLMEILSAGHFKDVGVCLDVGHAHLDTGISNAIATLAERIRSTHLHDNAADRDSHLWPGDGTIAWPETMQALAALPHPPATVLELSRNTEETGDALIQRLRRTFAWLDQCAERKNDR